MTNPEFKVWLKDYNAAFPDTATWLTNSADAKATLGYWFQALEHTDLADAKEVTRRMAVGEEAAVLPYEREATPRMVATAAKRVRSGKRITPKRELLPDYGGDKWSSGGVYKAVLEGMKAGRSIKDLVRELVPADDNPPRYRCLRCRDTGSVLVWSNATIHAVMKGAEHVPLKRCSVRCQCAANRRWSESFPVYDESKFCLFSGYGAIEEVRQWCEVYKQCKLASMPNYDSRFESGNW